MNSKIPNVLRVKLQGKYQTLHSTDLNEIWYASRSKCLTIITAIIAIDAQPTTSEIIIKIEIMRRVVVHIRLVEWDRSASDM